MVSSFKILISTWGNPKGWKRVKYRYKGKEICSKDPLPLIKDVENIDKTIIISLDTLSDEGFSDLKCSFTYNNLKGKSEEIICDFCKKEFNNCLPDKVIISYGVGEFNNIKFIGNSMDFYYSVFKELAIILSDWLKNKNNQNIHIFLDISHGINFSPVLTYRALREILQILSYTFEIKLTVLNSDTYIRGVEPEYLNINIIEDTKISPKIFVHRTNKRIIEPFYSLSDEEKGEIGRELSSFSIPDELILFLSSFMFALPVLVLNYMPESIKLREKIKKISKEFNSYIEIRKNKKYEAERKVEFTSNFENLVKSYLVSYLLEKFSFSKKEEISLSDIQKIKDYLWKKFPIESNRIDVEINEIGKLQIPNDWKVFAEIKGFEVKETIDKRNFFAHAGFEYNSIMLKRDKENVKIKINKCFENQIKNLLKENLTGG